MIRINLAPPDRRRASISFLKMELPAPDLGVLFAIIYIVAVVAIGATWWWRSTTESLLRAAVQKDKAELASLRATMGQGAKIKEQLAALRGRLKAIEDLTRNQGRPIALLDAFLDTVPSDLWITTMEERGAGLKIAGTAYSPTAVADFMANLRGSGRFKDIDIIIAKSDLAKHPRPVAFEVTCRFEF